MPTKRLALLFSAVSLLAACASKPPDKAPTPAPVEAPTPAPEAPPPPPAPPMAPDVARKATLAAADLLEAGNEDQAKAELQRVLAGDPGNKLAQSLLKQISADPVATLGRESFAYTVRASDTLSKIAGRFLGDVYLFYVLARYNDIKVPKQVAGGQVLRIPGKAPREPALAPPPPAPPVVKEPPAPPPVATAPPPAPPVAPPPPEPTPGEKAMASAAAAEKAGDLRRALAEYKRAAGLDQPGASAKAESMRSELIRRGTVQARNAFAKQDLTGAIQSWDRVLELDPTNETAKLERQKAIDLKKKIDAIK